VYNLLFRYVADFLEKKRHIGSMTYEIGSILLFALIIYLSHLLQKGVGSLLGNGDNWDPEVKKNSSRLAMTRLILIVLGFVLAVAASGLPVDKITIVLGALGVGIGLGLQAIVNNLMSGVILIFEQPFRIGDYIQLAERKGRVLDIGIRSSKLLMEDGAELIVPNADLLSGTVVNWTTRDDNVRISLPVNIETGPALDKVQKIILEALQANDRVIPDPPPEILLAGRSEKELNLNILVWISDVHRMQAIKSELLRLIYSSLTAQDIKIV
jgi:small-conductance mechanosensitive channel